MPKTRTRGLIAAPFTPFRKDGSLWLDQVGVQAAHLVRNGVVGAFVAGTTGEGQSLIAVTVADAPNGLKIIVHAGDNSLEGCRQIAAYAQEVGAHAIAIMPPFFFKPASVAQLVAFCREVAATAPKLPFYFYHIPAMTGGNFPMRAFLTAAGPRIPTLVGVKFTYENLMDYTQCLALEGGRYDMLFGRDEILLCGLTLGAQGAVGSSYNYAAPLYRKLMLAFAQGNLTAARAWQRKAQDMFQTMWDTGLPSMSAGKAVMKMIGVDCGSPRLPFPALARTDVARLRRALDRIDFWDYASK